MKSGILEGQAVLRGARAWRVQRRILITWIKYNFQGKHTYKHSYPSLSVSKSKHFTRNRLITNAEWLSLLLNFHLSSSCYIPDTELHTLTQIRVFHNERGFSLSLKRKSMQLKPGPPLTSGGALGKRTMRAHIITLNCYPLADCHRILLH